MDFLYSLAEFKRRSVSRLIYYHPHNLKANNSDLLSTVASSLTTKYEYFVAQTNIADKFYDLYLS